MSERPESLQARVARSLEAAWLKRGLLAWLLLPWSGLYWAVTTVNRWLWISGWRQPGKVGIPVLVVGNIIAGGAGKTPTVLACVAMLRSLGYTPGVISRGYGRTDGRTSDASIDVRPDSPASDVGDEPLMIRLRTRAPVCVGSDRLVAARALRAAHPEVDVIVSDDGLQHWRLARNAAVMVFDERGVGNGWLLPAGPLREALPRRVPVHTIVLYNARAASTSLPGFAARPALLGVSSLAQWWAAHEAPSMDALISLRGRKILAVAGVARPERFFGMLESAGLDIERLPLPDHFSFSGVDLPWPADTPDVVLTEKDAVKLRPDSVGSVRVWVVALDFEPEPAFEIALRSLFPPTINVAARN